MENESEKKQKDNSKGRQTGPGFGPKTKLRKLEQKTIDPLRKTEWLTQYEGAIHNVDRKRLTKHVLYKMEKLENLIYSCAKTHCNLGKISGWLEDLMAGQSVRLKGDLENTILTAKTNWGAPGPEYEAMKAQLEQNSVAYDRMKAVLNITKRAKKEERLARMTKEEMGYLIFFGEKEAKNLLIIGESLIACSKRVIKKGCNIKEEPQYQHSKKSGNNEKPLETKKYIHTPSGYVSIGELVNLLDSSKNTKWWEGVGSILKLVNNLTSPSQPIVGREGYLVQLTSIPTTVIAIKNTAEDVKKLI